VRARFERAVQRRAAGEAARLLERIDLGVRLTRAFVRPLADDHAFVRDHACAYYGIRRRASEAAPRMLEGTPHPSMVVYHFSWNSAST
jgi:hypothetical protein